MNLSVKLLVMNLCFVMQLHGAAVVRNCAHVHGAFLSTLRSMHPKRLTGLSFDDYNRNDTEGYWNPQLSTPFQELRIANRLIYKHLLFKESNQPNVFDKREIGMLQEKIENFRVIQASKRLASATTESDYRILLGQALKNTRIFGKFLRFLEDHGTPCSSYHLDEKIMGDIFHLEKAAELNLAIALVKTEGAAELLAQGQWTEEQINQAKYILYKAFPGIKIKD